MAGEWREAALGDVIELKRGFDLPQQDRVRGSFPIVSSSGVTDHHCVAKVKGPGVVTGRYGTLGEVFFVQEDFWPLNTTLYVRDFKGNDPRFVSYLLRTVDFFAYSDKAAVPGVNRNHLHLARVFVPTEVSEQQAIARVLGTLDDKIELNRQMNETLEGMARALFKSWFVDFDPVRAKVEKRESHLPQALAGLFPSTLEVADAGEIPHGWRPVPLPDVIDVNPSRPLRHGDIAPYVDMANMPTRGHVPDLIIDRPFGSGMRFSNGDTLVARITPCLENGKTAYVDFLKPNQIGWGSTEYIVLRPKAPLPPEYGYFLARSNQFRDFAIQSMTGSSGRQRVPAEALNHFTVAVPTDEIAAEFGKIANPLMARTSAAVKQSRILATLRDTLLPKLISGELRLRDVERTVGADT